MQRCALLLVCVVVAAVSVTGAAAAADEGEIVINITDNGEPYNDSGVISVYHNGDFEFETVSSDGVVQESGMPYGDYYIEVNLDETNGVDYRSHTFTHESNQTEVQWDLTESLGDVQVTITNQSGDAIAGRSVSLLAADNTTFSTSSTDSSGSVTFANVQYGEYQIEVDMPSETVVSDTFSHADLTTYQSLTLNTTDSTDDGTNDGSDGSDDGSNDSTDDSTDNTTDDDTSGADDDTETSWPVVGSGESPSPDVVLIAVALLISGAVILRRIN